MSEAVYSYAYFDVINFSNQFETSGYALTISPFTFKPRYSTDAFSTKRILWNFGDGTLSKSVTAVHSYAAPGTYNVSLYLYDGEGEAFYDSFTQTIQVYNFVTDSIVLSAHNLNFLASSIESNVFNVLRFNSWQTYNALSAVGYTIALAASGNNAPFISQQNYNADKYAHLGKYSQFYQYEYVASTDLYDYVAKDVFTTSNTELYAKIDGDAIVFCNSADDGSIFVGTSGYAVATYKDDIATTDHPTLIFAHFDNINFPDYDIKVASIESTNPVLQTNAQSFYCTVTALPPAGLFFSSNGLSSMPINDVQFTNTKIPFIVQIIDSNNASCKYCENLTRLSTSVPLTANSIQLAVWDVINSQPITAAFVDSFGSFADSDTGIYKGYCGFDTPYESVCLVANADVTSDFGTSTFTVSSNNFAVVGTNYNAAKVGEDFDASETIKAYRFQETLLDKTAFFDGFIGSIVGSVSSPTYALGKRINEKITNFVANTQDVDTCNIPALYSMKQMLNINVKQFERYNFSVPAELARLMDILSIKQSKLWGSSNNFAENFDKKGLPYSTKWGVNLGEPLNAMTAMLTAGAYTQPIVAYEKFSNTFKLIHTDALSSQHLTFVDPIKQTYPLSAYNDYWGWGLILPESFDPAIFDHYYIFYRYVPGYEGTILDSIINWSDSNTTISRTLSSYSKWSSDNGIMQTIIANTLFRGLSLFAPVADQYLPFLLLDDAMLLDDNSTFITLDDNISTLLFD